MNAQAKKLSHGLRGGRVISRLALIFLPLPKNSFCSIDVTNRCNLRCNHCYFFSYDQDCGPELSDDAWLTKIAAMQQGRRPFYNCTWVGGEPLLRKNIVEMGKRYFRSNRVVTNGTIPIPEWPDVEFHVSVDGTEPIHDGIRGAGCYSKIRKNLYDPKCRNLKIALACCINKNNESCIEDLVDEWRENSGIRHILFDFFTPIVGVKEDMWLDFSERDAVLTRIEALRAKFGKFIGAPPKTFWFMRKKNMHLAIGDKCVFSKYATAFDAWGNVKRPCVIGPKADCSRCGCIVPFSLRAWKEPSNLLREAWQELTANKQ